MPATLTYTLGNIVAWAVVCALALSSDPWYWWPVVPLLCAAACYALHHRSHRPPRPRSSAVGHRRLVHG